MYVFQECYPQVQCVHHIVQQPLITHSPHCQQFHSSQQIKSITESDSTSANIVNELCHDGSSQIHEQVSPADSWQTKITFLNPCHTTLQVLIFFYSFIYLSSTVHSAQYTFFFGVSDLLIFFQIFISALHFHQNNWELCHWHLHCAITF